MDSTPPTKNDIQTCCHLGNFNQFITCIRATHTLIALETAAKTARIGSQRKPPSPRCRNQIESTVQARSEKATFHHGQGGTDERSSRRCCSKNTTNCLRGNAACCACYIHNLTLSACIITSNINISLYQTPLKRLKMCAAYGKQSAIAADSSSSRNASSTVHQHMTTSTRARQPAEQVVHAPDCRGRYLCLQYN